MGIAKINSVLLVDDDKITNFINEKIIHKLGVSEKVVVLNNGKEAIDYISKVKISEQASMPELIFLDINMPVMDGFEFIENFRHIKPDKKVVIIMLTTSSNDKDLEKISDTSEIAGYINKPLTEQKLQEALQKYLQLNA